MSAILDKLSLAELGDPSLPLQNGDCMISSEFLRRAETCHSEQRVELIDGIVFMLPPLSAEHGGLDSIMETWLGVFAAHTPGIEHFINTTLIVDADTTVQPDS